MTKLDQLEARMRQAAAANQRDEVAQAARFFIIKRGGASLEEAEATDTTGLKRQQPGAMGLGTSQQKVSPPAGWKPPARPDPMTRGRSRRR